MTVRSLRVHHQALLWPLLIILADPLHAADFTGKVVGITDGDAITVLHNGRGEKIRLSGIDCPEKRQPFGTAAKHFTCFRPGIEAVEIV